MKLIFSALALLVFVLVMRGVFSDVAAKVGQLDSVLEQARAASK